MMIEIHLKDFFTASKKDDFCETFSRNLGKLNCNSSINNNSLKNADEALKKLILTTAHL